MIERRALYNLLRMNWLNEPTLSVEPWQVEDYRSLTLAHLFQRLTNFNIYLDRASLIAYAEECDSPEELTDHLQGDRKLSKSQEDEMFLILFELWRRLMIEKPSLSIICNELDHQIFLYDQQQLENPLALQDAIAQFLQILTENVDQGISSEEVLKLISNYCANDVETFLYDFISEQIDEGNETYAHELLEEFNPYLLNNKWIKLLHLRLCEYSKFIQKIVEDIVEEYFLEDDLDYYLELLSILIEKNNDHFFRMTLKKIFPLLQREEEFQDLLAIVIDFFQRTEKLQSEITLKEILERRIFFPKDQILHQEDPDLIKLNQLFNLKKS